MQPLADRTGGPCILTLNIPDGSSVTSCRSRSGIYSTRKDSYLLPVPIHTDIKPASRVKARKGPGMQAE